MTPANLKAARLSLLTTVGKKPMTQRQLGTPMEIDSRAVRANMRERTPAPLSSVRLQRAYQSQHSPKH